MKSSREMAQTLVSKAADAAVATVGNAAGATVAPRTAVTKVRTKAASPGVLIVVLALGLAYVLGRRARREV